MTAVQLVALGLGALGATTAAWLIVHSDARTRSERWALVAVAITQCLTLVTLVLLAGSR